MTFIIAAIAIFAFAVVFLVLAARERSYEMSLGGGAILLSAIALVTLAALFVR